MVEAALDSELVGFPNRLRKLRNQAGLTQQELSRLCGIGLNQIAVYERGEREPTAGTLVKIARGLNVSLDYLAGLTDEQHGVMVGEELTPYEREVINTLRTEGWPGVAHLSVERMSK